MLLARNSEQKNRSPSLKTVQQKKTAMLKSRARKKRLNCGLSTANASRSLEPFGTIRAVSTNPSRPGQIVISGDQLWPHGAHTGPWPIVGQFGSMAPNQKNTSGTHNSKIASLHIYFRFRRGCNYTFCCYHVSPFLWGKRKYYVYRKIRKEINLVK